MTLRQQIKEAIEKNVWINKDEVDFIVAPLLEICKDEMLKFYKTASTSVHLRDENGKNHFLLSDIVLSDEELLTLYLERKDK